MSVKFKTYSGSRTPIHKDKGEDTILASGRGVDRGEDTERQGGTYIASAGGRQRGYYEETPQQKQPRQRQVGQARARILHI